MDTIATMDTMDTIATNLCHPLHELTLTVTMLPGSVLQLTNRTVFVHMLPSWIQPLWTDEDILVLWTEEEILVLQTEEEILVLLTEEEILGPLFTRIDLVRDPQDLRVPVLDHLKKMMTMMKERMMKVTSWKGQEIRQIMLA